MYHLYFDLEKCVAFDLFLCRLFLDVFLVNNSNSSLSSIPILVDRSSFYHPSILNPLIQREMVWNLSINFSPRSSKVLY